MTAKAWTHSEIMGFVPYEIPDMFGDVKNSIGVGVMPKNAAGQAVPTLAELLAPYAAINPQACRLVFASPLMYQVLAATASLARKLIDEIDALVITGHVKAEVMQSLVALYEAIERESLTAMQVATEGHETVANGLKGGLKS